MIYKRNAISFFLYFTLLIILFFSYFSEIYFIKIYTVLVFFNFLITLKILYKNKNGLLFVYLIYLFLSCLSIPLVELFVEEPLKELSVTTSWYYSLYSEKSILISFIFVVVFCLYASLFTSKKRVEWHNALSLKDTQSTKYFVFGCTLIFLFFIFLSYQFATGNLPIFSSYGDYFSRLTNIPFYSNFIFIYSIGIISLLASTSAKNLKYSFLIIMIPGLLLLITGNRGELMYPLLAGIGILLVRGLKINIKLVLSLGIVFFIIIPLVGEVRNMDSLDEVNELSISPADPFITIGYTLRPLVFTVEWIENGEEYLYGESFIVPVQRGIANNIPGVEAISYEGKSYNYRDRLPTMGYSIIAESYHNFGVISSFIIVPLIIVLLLFGEKSNTINRLIISGGIAAILINNVRNAFSYVPGQIIMLLLLVIIFNISWKILTQEKFRSIL